MTAFFDAGLIGRPVYLLAAEVAAYLGVPVAEVINAARAYGFPTTSDPQGRALIGLDRARAVAIRLRHPTRKDNHERTT
jgi:hypothetical protein